MSSTDVVDPVDLGTDVATQQDEVAALIKAQQAEEYGDDDLLQTPILKIGQALTREVQDGEAEAGEFIETLTNESLGTSVEFIPCYYNRGRFASDDDRAYVAFTSTIPDSWEDLKGVGAEHIGQPFGEHPEAEEVFKTRVRNKEIPWGHGPKISTTHNFTGLVIVEGEDGPELRPARLSLQRTNVPAARKINTLLNMTLGSKPFWDVVLKLSTTKKQWDKNSSFVINPSDVKIVRKTDAAEKAEGANLALAVVHGRTTSVGAEDVLDERPAEPAANGGLAVD